jgi:DNA helicase HerA-like ATPase
VSVAAETFRPNPEFDTAEVITQLMVGEALVSVLDEKGTPTIVERTLIAPPASRVGPATPEERKAAMASSPVGSTYDGAVDRESAYEKLAARAQERQAEAEAADNAEPERREPARRSDSIVESMAKSFVRAASSQIGRQLVRGILGGLLGGATRRRR